MKKEYLAPECEILLGFNERVLSEEDVPVFGVSNELEYPEDEEA